MLLVASPLVGNMRQTTVWWFCINILYILTASGDPPATHGYLGDFLSHTSLHEKWGWGSFLSKRVGRLYPPMNENTASFDTERTEVRRTEYRKRGRLNERYQVCLVGGGGNCLYTLWNIKIRWQVVLFNSHFVFSKYFFFNRTYCHHTLFVVSEKLCLTSLYLLYALILITIRSLELWNPFWAFQYFPIKPYLSTLFNPRHHLVTRCDYGYRPMWWALRASYWMVYYQPYNTKWKTLWDFLLLCIIGRR